MKKATLLVLSLIVICLISSGQMRIAISGGAQQSKVLEENQLQYWDSLKNYYSERTGFHVGFSADMPLGIHSHFFFQPGVFYSTKGRKYEQTFDTLTGIVYKKNTTQYVNYIDIPLNIVFKYGKQIKFIIGAGPYVSFFYSAKETSRTVMTEHRFESDDNSDPGVGNDPGQYQLFNYGVNGFAGVEYKRIFLTANYNRGLNDFYQAATYKGDFKHQVIGITFGIYLGKAIMPDDK